LYVLLPVAVEGEVGVKVQEGGDGRVVADLLKEDWEIVDVALIGFTDYRVERLTLVD
jgi:hypothetical protein